MRAVLTLASFVTFLVSPAFACDDHVPGTEPAKRSVSRPSGWIVGEVRKVDLDDGTIALSHGKIAPWKMGPMESMVFQAREAGSISGFKVGDKIKFRAGWVRQQPTVVQINPAIK